MSTREKRIKGFVNGWSNGSVLIRITNNKDLYSLSPEQEITLIISEPEPEIKLTPTSYWAAIKELKDEQGGVTGPDVLFEKLFGGGKK